MKTAQELKDLVKQKYSEIALQDQNENRASCCGSGECSTEVYNIMSDSYENLEGYNPEADLGLGCGLPTEYALIKEGDTVLDLGSGAGNDCFVARAQTGVKGKVIGVDFTPIMIEKARENGEKREFNNVEFRLGDIEKLPVSSNLVDVVVSNCVLNLVPNKKGVFDEIIRVLKPGGHFSISDVVLIGDLPLELTQQAEMYAGCVSGAIQKEAYLDLIKESGFVGIEIQKEKPILLPDDILKNYLGDEALVLFKNSNIGIFSITVFAKKPNNCNPGTGCC
ncbi:arsenite methyltransferase [Lutibacter sp.]|uniref:arsenite methyltransferase n=1 Tax=Lutibacter sp. TaxID=1925666 RepID=UPI00273620C7|nr:arsenite methyltransferase [Lutibacter sp.]MDP3312849.1 arsenite methyltransferase [Lutibacter sp.]